MLKSNVKEALIDILKEKTDRANNNGLAPNHKANPASTRILYHNGVTLDGTTVYQYGRPICNVVIHYSTKQKAKNGQPRMLVPSLQEFQLA